MDISRVSPTVASYSAPTTTSKTSSEKATSDEKPVDPQAKSKLSAEQLDQIQKLKARDTVVRQHEQAHLAASGGLATSGASYTYQKGPDGVNYAIGGEVSINVSAGRTPEDTIARAQIIQAAALAPADPSGQDRAVAAQAAQMAQAARAELAQKASEEASQASGKKGQVDKTYGVANEDSSTSGSVSVYA